MSENQKLVQRSLKRYLTEVIAHQSQNETSGGLTLKKRKKIINIDLNETN
jgi:hypothetical protein